MTDSVAERLSDKLRILSLHASEPGVLPSVSKFYFSAACQGDQQPNVFLLVARSLLQLCGRQQQARPQPHVAQSISSLLLEARAAGIEVKAIQVQDLQQGHGLAVCTFLDQLSDAALRHQGDTFAAPVRQQPRPPAPAAQEALVEVSANLQISLAAEDEATATAWQQEADQLEAEGLLSMPASTVPLSWQANLAAMREQAQQMQKLGLQAQQLLSSLEQEVEGDLQQLDVQQQRLSAQLHPELAELQAGQQVLDSLQQAELAKREAFLQGQDVLQEMSQELRQKKKQLQAATDETGNKQTLQEMRDAVARLDGELADMSVHVGLLQHQVIHKYPTHNPLPTVTTM